MTPASNILGTDLVTLDPVTPDLPSFGLGHPPSLRPSLLAVLLLDVLALGTWASWSAVHDRALRGALVSVSLCAPFLVMLVARPVARRLALNSARSGRSPRWPIIVSVALATALSTMAVVSLDSFSHSATTAVREQLGAVDEIIVAARPEARTAAQELVASAMVEDEASGRATPLAASIDGQIALTALAVAARATTGPAIDATAIEIDVPTVQRFAQSAGGADATGFAGRAPLGAAEVLLGRDLADDLGVAPGTDVTLTIGETPTTLRVVGVLPRLGVAGLSVDGAPRPRVAFVAPGLLTTAASPARPPSYLLAVSNTGDVQTGADLSELVTARLEELFEPEPVASDGIASAASAVSAASAASDGATPLATTLEGVSVIAVKRDLQLRVERDVAPLRKLFASLATVAVAVAAIFLALLMGQLVTRRRQAIVALRLIGVGRLDVSAAVALEAWMAAIVGVVVGSALGYALSLLLGSVAAMASSRSGVALAVDSAWPSALVGGSVGLGLAVAAIAVPLLALAGRSVLADLRRTRRAPARADRRVGVLILVVLGAGVVATVRGLRGERASDTFLGVGLVALAVVSWFRVRHRGAEAVVAGVVSAALLAGIVTARWTQPELVRSMGVSGFVVRAIVAVFAAALLSESLRRPIGSVVERIVRKAIDRPKTPIGQRSVVAGVSDAVRRAQPIRTLLFSAGFAAMFFLLAASWSLNSTLRSRIAADVAAASGGWDVTARVGDESMATLTALPGVVDVAVFGSRVVSVGAAASRVTAPATLLGFDTAYTARPAAELALRGSGWSNDLSVYEAVLGDDALAIVDPLAFPRGAATRDVEPGDTVFIRDPASGRSGAFTVAGTLRSGVGLAPVLVSQAALDAIGSGPPDRNRAVIRLSNGDANQWVKAQAGFAGSLRTFESAAQRENAAPRAILRVIRAFTAISALLSFGALAAATAEQVRRRQREFATLRSIGLYRQGLRAAVLAPTLILVADATLIGSVLGVLGAADLIHTGVLGNARLHAPWPTIVLTVVLAIGLSLVVAWRPAAKAAAMAPMRAMG